MTHPSDNDLDELEAALAEPDLENLNEHSEKYLRSVQALRHAYRAQQELIMQDEEGDDERSAAVDELDALWERVRGRL